MKKFFLLVAVCGLFGLFMSSCDTYRHSMKEPNVYFELYANDIELSEQVIGEATVTRIVGIDWERLFGTREIGESAITGVPEIPVIGNLLADAGVSYALYDLMQKYPGYDVVVYPQVETHKVAPVLGTNIYSTTTYKVTARLGKLKNK